MMKGDKNNILTPVLTVIFLVMLLYGCQSGEVQVVLQKSINICLECVGIG